MKRMLASFCLTAWSVHVTRSGSARRGRTRRHHCSGGPAGSTASACCRSHTALFTQNVLFRRATQSHERVTLFHFAETAARYGGAKCAAMFSLSAPPLPLASASSALRTTLDDRQGEHDTQTQPDPATPVLLQYDCTISQNYTRGFLHVASSSLVLCCEATGNVCFATDTLTRGISHAQCAATTTCLWRRLGGLATDYLACFRLCSCPCRHVERWTFSRAGSNYHHDKLLTQDRSCSRAASRRTSLPTLPTHGRQRPPSKHRPEGPRRRGTGQTCLLRKFLGPGNTRALAQTIATRQAPLHTHHSQGAVVAKANGKLRQLHVQCPFWCTPSGSNMGGGQTGTSALGTRLLPQRREEATLVCEQAGYDAGHEGFSTVDTLHDATNACAFTTPEAYGDTFSKHTIPEDHSLHDFFLQRQRHACVNVEAAEDLL